MSEGTLETPLVPNVLFLTRGDWNPVSLKGFPQDSEVTQDRDAT